MKFKDKRIEVIDDDNIIVYIETNEVKFNLKKGQIRKDLEGMNIVKSDEEFEAYLIRTAQEWINRGLHNKKTTSWLYDKTDEF